MLPTLALFLLAHYLKSIVVQRICSRLRRGTTADVAHNRGGFHVLVVHDRAIGVAVVFRIGIDIFTCTAGGRRRVVIGAVFIVHALEDLIAWGRRWSGMAVFFRLVIVVVVAAVSIVVSRGARSCSRAASELSAWFAISWTSCLSVAVAIGTFLCACGGSWWCVCFVLLSLLCF